MDTRAAESAAVRIRDLGKDLSWEGQTACLATKRQSKEELVVRVASLRKLLSRIEKAVIDLDAAVTHTTLDRDKAP